MFDAMGLGGGNSFLAGKPTSLPSTYPRRNIALIHLIRTAVSIVLGIPFPIWIFYKGEMLRRRNPMTRESVQ